MAQKGRIKGITIEIDGDTTGLQHSLSQVDSSLKNTQIALKDVNKLLKLDPSNTELLRQKHDLLKTSIGDTKDRLKQLKEAYKNIKADTPEELKEKQNALKREIIETEQSLKSLKDQMKDFGSVAKQKLDLAGDAIKNVGAKVTSFGGQMTAKVTAPLVAGFGLALDSASDYEENLNKLSVAFGDYADEVQAFTDSAQADYGLSMKDASASASAFGSLAKGIGLSEEEAANMSVELTKLSADLGSYFNTDVADSAAALEGIFTGNATSLKKFGVVMTDTNLKEFAEELGITAKQYAKLGQEDKTMLRFQYVMAKTADAQGDFARTNDGVANATKSLQASLSDVATIIGEKLIPIIVPIIQKATEIISKIFSIDDGILDMIVKIGLVIAAIGPVMAIIGTIISSVGTLTSAIGFLFTPMGGIIALIGAVIAAGVLLYQNWDKIKEVATNVWNKVKEDFQKAMDFLKEKIDWIVDKFNAFKEAIINAFDFSNITSKIGGFFSSVGNFFGGGASSGGFAMSGGYMSGSIVMNNSFTINGTVDKQTVLGWADLLTDRINENLGRRI